MSDPDFAEAFKAACRATAYGHAVPLVREEVAIDLPKSKRKKRPRKRTRDTRFHRRKP